MVNPQSSITPSSHHEQVTMETSESKASPSPQVTTHIYLNKAPGLVTEKLSWCVQAGCHAGVVQVAGRLCRAGFGGIACAGLCARECQNHFSGGPEGCTLIGCICIPTSASL